MKAKHAKEERPGNDILNGIERWIPEQDKDIPKQFRYESPASGIWYRNKWEAATCLARAGVPEEKWIPVLQNPWPDQPEANNG